jgi:hypothetical protein
MTDKIERAKAHLATCMEREDWPVHNCACDCGDVSELLAENDNLRQAIEQTWHPEVAALRLLVEETAKECGVQMTDNERLRAILAKGSVMIDSLDDEGEFDVDAVHAFAAALNEHSPVA